MNNNTQMGELVICENFTAIIAPSENKFRKLLAYKKNNNQYHWDWEHKSRLTKKNTKKRKRT